MLGVLALAAAFFLPRWGYEWLILASFFAFGLAMVVSSTFGEWFLKQAYLNSGFRPWRYRQEREEAWAAKPRWAIHAVRLLFGVWFAALSFFMLLDEIG